MFVVADNTHYLCPTYLLKVIEHNGFALGTIELNRAMIFKSWNDAQREKDKIKDHGTFNFKIHELGIVK